MAACRVPAGEYAAAPPNGKWSATDLARRVERTLEVAEAAIALVSVEDPGVDLEALEAPPNKIIAETAIFLRAALAVPRDLAPDVFRKADTLARALAPHARRRRIEVGIALHPALALDYGAAHLVLAKAGYPDPVFGRTLSAASRATTAHARERVPHRELEQGWLGWLLDGEPPTGEALRRTPLIRGTDVLTGSRDDVYALTHAILYATDFGNEPQFARVDHAFVLATVRSALAGAMDDDDFDLAGELLLTWPLLRADWDETSSLAFAVLAHVEDEVGVLPSLALDRQGYDRQRAASRKAYVAAVSYHTAYVMGLLCSTMLGHDSRPHAPHDAVGSDRLRELQNEATIGGRIPQWAAYLKALPRNRRPPCSSFLLDIALRRAARKLDLREIHRLLTVAVGDRSTGSPMCHQAAEMLHRLVAVSETATGEAMQPLGSSVIHVAALSSPRSPIG